MTKKEDMWQVLKPELYCIFWYMNIQSLCVPDKLYKEEIKSLSEQIKKLNDLISQLKAGKLSLDTIRQSGSNDAKEALNKYKKDVEKLSR